MFGPRSIRRRRAPMPGPSELHETYWSECDVDEELIRASPGYGFDSEAVIIRSS